MPSENSSFDPPSSSYTDFNVRKAARLPNKDLPTQTCVRFHSPLFSFIFSFSCHHVTTFTRS